MLERSGGGAASLLSRHRDPANRRVHLVELTDEGEALFHRLRKATVEFNQRLCGGLAETEPAQFEQTLARLRDNVAATGGD